MVKIEPDDARIHNVRIYVERPYYSRATQLVVMADVHGENEPPAIARFHWEQREPSAIALGQGSYIRLSERSNQAQNLMDQLWNQGIRPTEVDVEIGALPATQEHLKDMQGLVYQLLPKILKDD
jgi:hypothetical protein